MKPVCVPCQRFYRMTKAGYYFIEGMPTEPGALPGVTDSARWKPYKLWVGDLWECHGCGSELVVGVPPQPLGEHFQPDFEGMLEWYDPQLQVNDC